MSWYILLSAFVHYITILLSRLNNINMSNMRMILLLIICTLYRGCPFIRLSFWGGHGRPPSLCDIIFFLAASKVLHILFVVDQFRQIKDVAQQP